MKRKAMICLLAFFFIFTTGCAAHESGASCYLNGHGSFDREAMLLMPSLESIPDTAEVHVEYGKEWTPFDPFECVFLRLVFHEEDYDGFLKQLEKDLETDDIYGGEHRPFFYMLPTNDSGEPTSFCFKDYRFDPEYIVEQKLDGKTNLIRLIGLDDTQHRVVFLCFYTASGSSVRLDGLLAFHWFQQFAWD